VAADTDCDSPHDCRALGTPLDWPEAKKVASHVREWGIEVRNNQIHNPHPAPKASQASETSCGRGLTIRAK